MKRAMAVLVMSVAVILAMTVGTACAEEAAWYDAAENWIVRVYTTSSAPQSLTTAENVAVAGYGVMLEVVDTGNNLITDPIVGMATNPIQITGAADGPDVSLAFDGDTAMAYVFYTAGGVMLQAVPDIVRAAGVLTVTPNPVLFGNTTVGYSPKKTATVTNAGSLPLQITGISAPGTSFVIAAGTSTCAVGTSLAAGDSCSIVVKFTPSAAGPYEGSFVVSSNGGNVTVILKGSGL